MNTRGRHLLVEYTGCDVDVLDDLKRIEALMKEAARVAGATVVNSVFHAFAPHGVTGVGVVEESHLSIHTWPEAAYAAVDFFTCGDCVPEAAKDVLRDGLEAACVEIMMVDRGMGEPGHGIHLRSHRTELSASAEAVADPVTPTPRARA